MTKFITQSHVIRVSRDNVITIYRPLSDSLTDIRCNDAVYKKLYLRVLKAAQVPASESEILKRAYFSGCSRALLRTIFKALVLQRYIIDVSDYAYSMKALWQFPQPHEAVGYRSTVEAKNDIMAYSVAKSEYKSYRLSNHYQSERSSARNFLRKPITKTQLEQILTNSYQTAEDRFRPTASPGHIYPVHIHVMINEQRVTGEDGSFLEDGLYEYDPNNLTLEKRTESEFPVTEVMSFITDHLDASGPAIFMFLSTNLDAFKQKYANAGLIFNSLCVGSVMQRITDQVSTLKLGSVPLYAMRHHDADRLMQHPENIASMLLLAIGHPDPTRSQTYQTSVQTYLQSLVNCSPKEILETQELKLDNAFSDISLGYTTMTVKFRVKTGRNSFVTDYGFGTAKSRTEALLKAYAEAYERIASSVAYVDKNNTAASDLSGPYLDPRDVVPLDAQQMQLCGIEKFRTDLPIKWTLGTRLKSGEKIYIPSQMVFYPYIYAKDERAIALATSSGVGAHFDTQAAIENGLYELIERDALMRTWITAKKPPRILHSSLPTALRYRIASLEQSNLQVHILNLTDEHLISVFAVAITGNTFPYICIGASAHSQTLTAINKALDEAAIGYASRHRANRTILKKEKNKIKNHIFNTESHTMFYAINPEAREAVSWLLKGKSMQFKAPTAHAFDELVKSYDPIIVELKNPSQKSELKIVRVMSEKLIPITFGSMGVPYLHSSLHNLYKKPAMPHFFS